MHCIRAGILLKRDPADTAAAEQSLQAAIAVAQSQKARSFELRAALSLAKLYRAANRDADAHTVLAPAVDGFPPTPTIPRTHRGASPPLGAFGKRRREERRRIAPAPPWPPDRPRQCADMGQGTSGAGNECRLCARPRTGEPGGRRLRTVLCILWSLGRASDALRTRTDARNCRAFPARSHGPAGLPRGLDGTPHCRQHQLVFRRLCRRS